MIDTVEGYVGAFMSVSYLTARHIETLT